MSVGPGPEGDRIDSLLSRGLAAWTRFVVRRARAVTWITAALTVPVLFFTATQLGINTRHTALLSEDLPFWRDYTAFAEAFPILDEAILVVIDGETPDRARIAADELAARLAEGDGFSRVYVPGGGEFFERHALLYLTEDELYDLADNLAGVQPLLAELMRDRSLAGLASVIDEGIAYARTDETLSMNLTAAFDSLSLAAEAVLEGNPRPVSWIELLLNRAVPGESARRIVVLEPNLVYDNLFPAREAILDIRRAAEDLGLTPEQGVTVRITGNLALNYEEMTLVARQIGVAAFASVLLVAGILFLALGSRRLMGAVIVTLLVGLVWTGGFAAIAVGALNVISVAFAVLFIGLGVDFGIHICMRYAELMREGWEHENALAETAHSVGGALVVCAITTAIGFYVFVPTDYRAVAELGLISGTGMFISLAASLTLLPALLTLWGARFPSADRTATRWFADVLVPLAVRRSGTVLWIAAVLVVASIGGLRLVTFDHNVARIRDPGTESVETFEELLADSDTSPWTIDVRAKNLASAQALAAELRELAVVENAVTLADYVPENQRQKIAILRDLVLFLPGSVQFAPTAEPPEIASQIAALRSLRASLDEPWLAEGDPERGASAERAARYLDRFLARLATIERKQDALLSFERSLVGTLPDQIERLVNALDPSVVDISRLPDDLASRMLAPDGSARIEVFPSEDLADTAAHARFVDEVRAAAGQATGSAVTLIEWARAVVRSFQQALTSAFAAVAVVLWLLWRRFRDVGLVMVPLVAAAMLTGAAAGVLGIAFNFANIVVLPLLLGIGVDSGIHLVHRYRATPHPPSSHGAAHEMLGTSTAHAVFFSALTTMGSFGTIALSTHVGMATLGRLLLLGVSFTLAANLILLPALLTRADTRKRVAAR